MPGPYSLIEAGLCVRNFIVATHVKGALAIGLSVESVRQLLTLLEVLVVIKHYLNGTVGKKCQRAVLCNELCDVVAVVVAIGSLKLS